MLDHSCFVTLYSHRHVYKGEIQSNTLVFVSFHPATVNSRRMIVMITGVLKRLGTICGAVSDDLKQHATMFEDGGTSPATIGNLYPNVS